MPASGYTGHSVIASGSSVPRRTCGVLPPPRIFISRAYQIDAFGHGMLTVFILHERFKHGKDYSAVSTHTTSEPTDTGMEATAAAYYSVPIEPASRKPPVHAADAPRARMTIYILFRVLPAYRYWCYHSCRG